MILSQHISGLCPIASQFSCGHLNLWAALLKCACPAGHLDRIVSEELLERFSRWLSWAGKAAFDIEFRHRFSISSLLNVNLADGHGSSIEQPESKGCTSKSTGPGRELVAELFEEESAPEWGFSTNKATEQR